MQTKYIFSILFSIFVCFTACDIDEIENPNGPTIESLENGATQADLLLLASGLESVMRNDLVFYYTTSSIIGRDYYDLNETDPRYTGELLGAGSGDGVLDNNGFLTTRSFAAGYKTIRNAQILSNAVDNTIASLTAEEINGYKGFAELVTAYELLKLLNRQYQNGVRIDVSNPDALGPFVSYEDGMTNVATRLSNAISMFQSAGDGFNFNLSSGWSGFDTPAGMVEVANALLARVELYRGNDSAALTALGNSFFSLNGDLSTGAYHVFGTSGNDRRNPLFFVFDTDLYMAHPSFVADAEDGDTRLNKVVALDDPVTADELTAQDQVQLFGSDTDPLAIIRNEELILIYAEANVGTSNSEAVAAINVIRNSAGLDDYTGGEDDASLINEILKQRRYSLFAEGHRWIDMRRFGRLGELPLDRPGDEVFDQFPTPVTEVE